MEINHEIGEANPRSIPGTDVPARPGQYGGGERDNQPRAEVDAEASNPQVDSESVAVAIGSITGYRTWRVQDGRLLSMTNDTSWPLGGALKAKSCYHITEMIIKGVIGALAVWLGLKFTFWIHSNMMGWLGSESVLAPIIALMDAVLPFICVGVAIAPFIAAITVTNGQFAVNVLRSLKGNHVHPGERTPGIYALCAPRQPDYYSRSMNCLLVLGTVSLWGKTIEHEQGVKGQYAHPESITHVACVDCMDWMPIHKYTDATKPPTHADCKAPDSLLAAWKDPGLWKIHETCPGWFASSN